MAIATNLSRLTDDSQNNPAALVGQVLQQYASGSRNFQNYKLHRANLKRANLKNANLQGVDLSHANLREANLSGANLSHACLDGADLQGANLSNTSLTKASLKKVVLNNANLVKSCLEKSNLEGSFLLGTLLNEVNLKEACLKATHLNGAYLNDAYLVRANLSKAYLIGTHLIKANLMGANLCQAYLKGTHLYGCRLQDAYYNHRTCFDRDIDPTGLGMKKITIFTVEELLKLLNYLSDYSCNYFGRTLTARYLKLSCPTLPWFYQFQITTTAQISFSGDPDESLSLVQLEYAQKWINTFVGDCSKLVEGYSKLIDRDCLTLLK